jgi:glycosyltransferase involved in cell wall biosynthesis
MKIGIDASRAFQKNRTGIEEYSYQVIKHLMSKLEGHQVILYVKKSQKSKVKSQKLPDNWRFKIISFPYLWTQVGLSLEMLFHPVDILFISAHIVPCIHARNTIVTIHGLEYEFCLKAYSWWARIYMRWSIRKSCKWAKKIIAVSENTKRDLMKLYKVSENKIKVIYEGITYGVIASEAKQSQNNISTKIEDEIAAVAMLPRNDRVGKPYLLFIGRLEERKNICGIIEAYKILKEKYNIPHSLILAGAPGYNYKIIKLKIRFYLKIKNLKLKIIELGYIDEATKWQLMSNADIFLFPTFYEGFGLPILEAQSVGVPVVASDNSSIPEVVRLPLLPLGEGARRADEGNSDNLPHPSPLPEGVEDNYSALLVNPENPSEIAEAAYKLISNKELRNDIINKGYENVKRFSWEKCAEEIAGLLKE